MAGPLARVVNKPDFDRLLAVRSAARSAHFAIHHVDGAPSPRQPLRYQAPESKLSTGHQPVGSPDVDNFQAAIWLGCMVPKRHARRAVTRTLVKRQMRQAFEGSREGLPGGLWLLRLRAPFQRLLFPSAASGALRLAVRDELASLLKGLAASRGYHRSTLPTGAPE